jgi:hypothetical protein
MLVRDAVTEVLSGYVYLFREAQKRAGNEPLTPAEVRSVFQENAERINAARSKLLVAMREDVEPRSERQQGA